MGIIWRMKVWEIKMSSPLPSDEDKRDLILNEMSQRLNLETNFPAGSSISSGDVSSPDNFFIPSLICCKDRQLFLFCKVFNINFMCKYTLKIKSSGKKIFPERAPQAQRRLVFN